MDRALIDEFLDKFVGYASGATTIALLAVGDRSGLLSWLGENERGTVEDIASGADLDQRYVREIVSGLAAAGVLEYEADGSVFTLPPEHALFLTSETSPYFMGGWLDMVPAVMSQVDGVAAATVHGGGVGFEDFGPRIIRGIDRGNAPSQSVFLTSRWLPAIEGLAERLEEGIRVADVGCGAGTAARLVATEWPNSEVFGFDVSEESLAVARSRADGVANVHYESYSADSMPLDPGFDLITTFDVIHDLADPLAGLTRIRQALNDDGVYLMMEPNLSSDVTDNLTNVGALFYGISTMHCMTQSLAREGAGLGAAWGRQTAEDYCMRAGFGSFMELETISNKFSAFYEVRG